MWPRQHVHGASRDIDTQLCGRADVVVNRRWYIPAAATYREYQVNPITERQRSMFLRRSDSEGIHLYGISEPRQSYHSTSTIPFS